MISNINWLFIFIFILFSIFLLFFLFFYKKKNEKIIKRSLYECGFESLRDSISIICINMALIFVNLNLNTAFLVGMLNEVKNMAKRSASNLIKNLSGNKDIKVFSESIIPSDSAVTKIFSEQPKNPDKFWREVDHFNQLSPIQQDLIIEKLNKEDKEKWFKTRAGLFGLLGTIVTLTAATQCDDFFNSINKNPSDSGELLYAIPQAVIDNGYTAANSIWLSTTDRIDSYISKLDMKNQEIVAIEEDTNLQKDKKNNNN